MESPKIKKAATAVKKDSNMLKQLIDNILFSDEISDRVAAIKNLATEFAERVGKKFGGSSHNSDHNSDHEDKEITEHVKYEKTTVWSNETKEIRPLMIFKDQNGVYRFLTTYSNNGRDSDNPPEIISAASHKRFVKMVDEGKAELPELWLWHKNINLGQATAVTFDEDNGIAIATGYFTKQAEPFAEAMMKNRAFWGVSHGMPVDSIVRNKEDNTIIEQHITKEISILPLASAANKWADLHILKEISMGLNDEQQEQLITAGVPRGILGALLDNNEEVSKEMDAVGIERKEEAPAPVTETPVKEKEEGVDDGGAPIEEKQADVEPAFTSEQVQELGGALAEMLPSIVKQTVAHLEPLLKEIQEELSAHRKAIDEGFEGHIKQLPAKTLGAYMEGNSAFKSASDDDSTKIDGRSKLKQDGPIENMDDKALTVQTNHPQMDRVFSGIVDGDKLEDLGTPA